MYAKLDKLRDALEKARARRDAAEENVQRLEEKLKEEENLQIINNVSSYHLSPEQRRNTQRSCGKKERKKAFSLIINTLQRTVPARRCMYF